ncbi:MAG: 4-amino-4-deoxy-L-arabinose transferase and related glycosyltransferases of PMT family [Candidatus Roizmanbacteria bacterium GW2011_GWA2_36_23]|uniref:4-amino-4-deoxy-L-arabinose transferase and related glycosyltransferases of PMT family n=1 Tax=Candidatus Roizmanbacteria bacterium GW2011_GWA2_36_23 TaxID=1618480 RepID=A0A0G0EL83_9BACT|nr:MAG: 4-amino-4-deoxy-L-arabinose transferase and related glycosyltransferases of PMT family [Candidatus Roizmanbacteria bacterium GW2011_GWA2_36_23]
MSFILIIALGFRLYKINTPLADLHSWRQADTAAVSRNFSKNGINLLKPQYDDLSSNQTGRENPEGLRFVEFPIYNAIISISHNLFSGLPVEVHGRIVTAVFSLLIIAVIYYICLKEVGREAAAVASLTYAIFPYFVFFSRVVLPETSALSFAFIAVFFLYKYSEVKTMLPKIMLFSLSLLSFSLAVLVKPTAIFYGIALLYIFIRMYKFNVLKKIDFYLFFLLSIAPFLLWRLYISGFPEGIPPNDWLITSVNTYQGLQNIFLRPAFFRWIFFERLNNYILGGYLGFLLLLGLLIKPNRYLPHFLFASAIIYLFVFEGGNVQHEYYQTLILPPVAILIGSGTASLLKNRKMFLHPIFTYMTVLAVFMLSFFFSFYKVRDYYHIPEELPQIAKIVNSLTSDSDKIVTDRMGDTTLLYLMDRKGAPSVYKDPPELSRLGYSYLVTLNEGMRNDMKNKYKYQTIFENNKFALFKL